MSVMNKVDIRKAKKEDCAAMVSLITELAIYEKAGEQVEVTVGELERDGFGESPQFHVIMAELNGQVIGMSFYYYKYSTWKGCCLYLEDIIIKEEFRKIGVGSQLFEATIQVAKKEKVKRMEWQVLDWNEPAIQFYKKYNAELDKEWLNGRFYEEDLSRF